MRTVCASLAPMAYRFLAAAAVWGVAALPQEARCAADRASAARAYPVKSIRFIIASPPGGTGDGLARMIGPRLAEAWQHPVVLDNRPGANGIIGTEMTARSAPDGYTIAMVTSGLAIAPSLYTRVPYDPIRDFAPISHAMSVPTVLVVSPTAPLNSVADLVAAARAKPGTLTVASPGNGTIGHLALVLLQVTTRARYTHVPHKGGAPALADVQSSHVTAAFANAAQALPHVRAARLKALAVTSAGRARAVPELPTVAESGYPGFEATSWFGVLAPAKTADAIIAKLNAQILRILRSSEVEQRLNAQAADVVASDPRAFGRHIFSETRKWAQVVKQAGIKPN